ncbi:dTDP-4-dehydrorhamnose 3,5-epimerase [Actinosynnema sp. ALI-1.44]|uniref:dTDP-4-dehydrorhamnose 3,5-epimerase family protein n=1 Tax=Actinosynnema sp. ALI-1.44 TaxID=1933779 RepID=UPI00097BEE7F|nr:dTDP-4-dehydrorhamnose 3,5-epimerase family protein [Actinosynnema sp. ALI-1.44]ONI76350.1 dTDP-4-dehydrorhamnose 3,5-epimerase [Actinosynnema sp. ALI-1.44]
MRYRELAVRGAFEFTSQCFPDDRGFVVSPFDESTFAAATGRGLFPIAQITHSMSRRDVIRGVHFTATPPGNAKYVHCTHGKVLDIVVDLRLGSPTFGSWDTVDLTARNGRAVYAPVGTGHAFVALEEDSVISYLFSQKYDTGYELAVSVFDPMLGLPVPDRPGMLLSERDRAAPTLTELRDTGRLPLYEACLRLDEGLSRYAAGGHPY